MNYLIDPVKEAAHVFYAGYRVVRPWWAPRSTDVVDPPYSGERDFVKDWGGYPTGGFRSVLVGRAK